MSVQAMTRVMEHSEAEGITRLVLLVMANRAGGDHDECFASVDRLAHDCRVSRRTVQYATARLVASGDLVPAGIHAHHRTNVYRVMPAGGVQVLHGGADSRPGYAPELKELGVKGSATASTSQVLTSLAPTKSPRRRDPLFDAVVETCGLDPGELTDTARGAVNKALASLRRIGADPDEVPRRAEHFRAHFPDATLTPTALAKHWPLCRTGPRRTASRHPLDRMARELMAGG